MAARTSWNRCILLVNLSLSGLIFANFGSAQTYQFEGRRIVAIEYVPAPVPLTAKDLARFQVLKPGAVLQMSDVGATIDGLYSTGRFEDIQVEADPDGANGVIIHIVTKPSWFVGHVDAAGKTSAPPNRGQIINNTQLNLGAPFHDSDLKTAEENLTRLFHNEGLYEATQKPRLVRHPETQSVDIVFDLHIGKRAKYSEPVIKGNPKLPDATILRATGWRVPVIHWWRQVSQAKTTGGLNGIHNKYQKQERLTATVQMESLNYDAATRKVTPHLDIEAGPKVKITAIEAKVPKSKLRSYVPVYDEGTVDNDLLVEGQRNLRSYFQAQGYYDAAVSFREKPVENDQLTIEYVIARGSRYKLASVQIDGNRFFKTDAIRERMFLEPNSLQYLHGRYSEAFRKKDEEAISNLYHANGFRDVKVTSELLNPYKGKAGEIGVIFHVEEGPQSFVDALHFEGNTSMSTDVLLSKASSVAGQAYSDVNVATDRNAILTTYYAAGYPAAGFEYKAEPAAAPHHFVLTYVVKEGQREFVRDVAIEGLSQTRRSLVEKQMTLKPGDPLAPTKMTDAQRNLYNLGIFAKVDTAVQNPDGDEIDKYVLYDFEEAHRYSLNLGVGAEIAQIGGTTSNLSSPGGATGFSPRFSLNVSRLNLWGLGHTVSFRGILSNLEQRASIEYLQPRFMNRSGLNLTYSLLYDNARDVRTFSSKREEASVQAAQQLTKANKVLLRFAYRRVTTGDVVIPTLLVPQLLQPLRIGILTANFVQDRRDNPADAHRGIYNTVDGGLAANFFGSQRNFMRVLARNATYTPIGKKIVFARQTQFGVILPYSPPAGISAAESVPLPERFFGGGATSDRGFPFNQAGPRDIGTPAAAGAMATQPTGFPLGGNALFFNTFELRFPLVGENLGGVLFHDAGNIYRSVSDISFRFSQRNLQDFNYMVHAVGFGVRYKTPIGPIRLDLAYSINSPDFVGFKGTQLELLSCNPNLPQSQLPSVCQGVKQNLGHIQFFFSIGQAF